AAAAVPASAASAPSAPPGGNDLDLVVVGGQVYQSIQTGTTTLVAGKSTFVRCRVVAQGTIPPGAEYDGRMRVFDGGVELPESPIYSTNGPIPVTPLPTLEIDGSLNFVFLPPDTSNLSFIFEINPAGPGQLAETTYANNTVAQGPFAFECKRRPEMIYVPIDYRPSGGSIPNPPDPNLVQPGMGDAFVQGIYPSADWDYRCYDQGTKLWTESLAGSGSALNNSLTAEWQLMNPKPDYMYGWVPGGLGYNGQSIIGGVASMGNTEPIRFQRTFAHELGHNTGLQHNNTTTFTLGVDVEHHLLEPQGLGQFKDPNLKDIMVAGLLTHEAWVAPSNYQHFVSHPTFVCAQPAKAPAGELLMVLGVLNRSQRTVDLDAGVVFTGGVPTPTVPVAEADLVLRVVLASGAVAEYGLAVRSSADCPECAGGDGDTPHEDPLAGFVAV
ncbi:MAG TPA: hypothetical protein VJP77_00450, partial [Planctomycetota bacterium]|nr:hypothetical protein [Planctomycetota bacterium]